MIYALLSGVFLFALAAVRAIRDEHLVVLRWPVGYFFMERQTDGGYLLVSPVRLPLAVLRYSWLALGAAAFSLTRRVRPRAAHTRVAYR